MQSAPCVQLNAVVNGTELWTMYMLLISCRMEAAVRTLIRSVVRGSVFSSPTRRPNTAHPISHRFIP